MLRNLYWTMKQMRTMIQVILELLKIGMVVLLSLRTKEAVAPRRMPQRKLKLRVRRMRLTMSSLLPDQVEMASKDLGNQLMMIILKRNQPQTVNLMLKMSKKTATKSPNNVRSEPLTTRRRALQSWMDVSGSSTVEFPDGLLSDSFKKNV